MLSEDDISAAVASASLLPYDAEQWPTALEWAMRAGNGWCAHLLGVTPRGVEFNIAHKIPHELNREFELRGGADLMLNPRASVLI